MNDDEIPQEEIDKIMEEKDCDKETACHYIKIDKNEIK